MSAKVEAAATVSEPIVGIHSKLPKIGLEVGKTYQLLPLFIELGASDRKRLFFTVCYRGKNLRIGVLLQIPVIMV